MGADTSMETRLSPDEQKEWYKEATHFTTSIVFDVGDGRPGPEV